MASVRKALVGQIRTKLDGLQLHGALVYSMHYTPASTLWEIIKYFLAY